VCSSDLSPTAHICRMWPAQLAAGEFLEQGTIYYLASAHAHGGDILAPFRTIREDKKWGIIRAAIRMVCLPSSRSLMTNRKTHDWKKNEQPGLVKVKTGEQAWPNSLLI